MSVHVQGLSLLNALDALDEWPAIYAVARSRSLNLAKSISWLWTWTIRRCNVCFLAFILLYRMPSAQHLRTHSSKG